MSPPCVESLKGHAIAPPPPISRHRDFFVFRRVDPQRSRHLLWDRFSTASRGRKLRMTSRRDFFTTSPQDFSRRWGSGSPSTPLSPPSPLLSCALLRLSSPFALLPRRGAQHMYGNSWHILWQLASEMPGALVASAQGALRGPASIQWKGCPVVTAPPRHYRPQDDALKQAPSAVVVVVAVIVVVVTTTVMEQGASSSLRPPPRDF